MPGVVCGLRPLLQGTVAFLPGGTGRPWAKQRSKSTGLPPQEQLATLHLVQMTGISVEGGGNAPSALGVAKRHQLL